MKIIPHDGVPASAANAGWVWRITLWLLAAVGVLVVMHVLGLTAPREMSITTLRMMLDKFHLDREGNVPSWFSSTLLTAGAALMIGIGVWARRRGEGFDRRWIVMGAIFVLLSMDETASFHEMAIHPVRHRLHLDDIGIFHFAWIVPALVMLAVLTVIYLPFIFALPARTRWGLIAAAVVYVSGTIGMEMFGGTIAADGRADTTLFAVTITIEETLELLGLVLLLHTLMMHAFVRPTAPAAVPPTPASAASDHRRSPELSRITNQRPPPINQGQSRMALPQASTLCL